MARKERQVKSKISLWGFRKGLLQNEASEQRPECNEEMICQDPRKAEGTVDAKALRWDDVPSSRTRRGLTRVCLEEIRWTGSQAACPESLTHPII